METGLVRFFPRTMALVRQTPLCTAMLSVVPAGKVIKPHTGDFKGILRYHLGLHIPPRPPDAGRLRTLHLAIRLITCW